MKEQVVCIVDCRMDSVQENDYFTLNLWGKPVFFYVLEECLKSECFLEVHVITNFEYLKAVARENFGERVIIESDLSKEARENVVGNQKRYFIVHGCAVMLKRETIVKILAFKEKSNIYSAKRIKKHILYPDTLRITTEEIRTNTFIVMNEIVSDEMKEKSYLLNSDEAFVIQTRNDFELALVLKKKEQNAVVLLNTIKDRIQQKSEILQGSVYDSVCLLGHSQFDDWDISKLCGMPVRNCGIRGVSSFQYREMILEKGLLDCGSNIFVILQGTNDIVYSYSIGQIVESIQKIIFYIRIHNPNALIFVVSCLHVNGRADRSNQVIDKLNSELYGMIKNYTALWIHTNIMDDCFGNLKQEYTCDGLHLSEIGYMVFKKLLEKEIGRILKCEE